MDSEETAESLDNNLSERTAARSDVLADRLLAAQTPTQQALAGKIYRRLAAGSETEEVDGLIRELGATMVREATRAPRPPTQTPAQRSPQVVAPGDDEPEWTFRWDKG